MTILSRLVEFIEVDADGVEIGRRMVDLPPEPPLAPAVRQRVTKAALKMAAGQAGLLGQINNFVAQLPYDAPAKILYEDATDFRRSDALWDFMAFQFGVTPEFVDDLFNMAGQIDDIFNKV
jgi:hypothetical protein